MCIYTKSLLSIELWGFWWKMLFRGLLLWTRKGAKGRGRHIGSHESFQSYALHNRRKNKRKQVEGGCSCFEEAQDSYGLEANHRCCPQRDDSYAPREREKDVKCKRSRRTGRSGGISRIAAKNWKLLCGVEEVRGNLEFKQNETKFPQSI